MSFLFRRKGQNYKGESYSRYWETHTEGGIYTLTEILETIEERIPSPEKLFGYIWIVSWFIAIWAYHIQFFVTGLFCLFLAYVIFERNEEKERNKFPAVFTMDKATKTLTVQKLYDSNLNWEKTEVCSGNATLPKGGMKEGDVVTNCNGNVALRHIPSNILFGGYDFK